MTRLYKLNGKTVGTMGDEKTYRRMVRKDEHFLKVLSAYGIQDWTKSKRK